MLWKSNARTPNVKPLFRYGNWKRMAMVRLFGENGSEISCTDCRYFFSFDKNGKIEQFADDEDKYIELFSNYKK